MYLGLRTKHISFGSVSADSNGYVFKIKAVQLGKGHFSFFLKSVCPCLRVCMCVCMCIFACLANEKRKKNGPSDGQCHLKLLVLFDILGQLRCISSFWGWIGWAILSNDAIGVWGRTVSCCPGLPFALWNGSIPDPLSLVSPSLNDNQKGLQKLP